MESQAYIFQRMCRTCMMKDQSFHSIYENPENQLKICEMLATVTPQLLIQSSDQLPQQLCVACLNKLNIAYSFQQMCIASEKQLINILSADSAALPNELPFIAATTNTVGQDPLLVEEVPKFTICIKSEENEEPEDIKDIVVEDFTLSVQQLDASKMVAELQSEEACANNTNIDQSSECDETEDDDDDDDDDEEELQNTSRISDMHNETGVNEIEKPSPRNRRGANLACPHCDKVFDRVYNFKRHAQAHSEKGRFKIKSSSQCDAPKTREKIRNRPPPPPDGFKCPECPRRFEKGQSLAAHMHIHRKTIDVQTFKCDMCPKKFHKFTQLVKHAQTHPENQKYKCTQCEKTFALEAHFIEHMNKHNGLKPYVCVYCNKAFQHNSLLIDHKRSHTGERPCLCAQCGKSFKNAGNLKQHQLRHSGEKRFQCPECPSKFTCQSDQIKHTVIHRALKPHKCDICGSCFTRANSLNMHKKRHIGERPHVCRECNMSFIFIHQLKKHKITHTGEKPHKCTFCERAFAMYADLNKHLRLHVGEKTYMCDQCPEKFKYKAELRDHQAMHYKQQKAAVAAITASAESKDEVKAAEI